MRQASERVRGVGGERETEGVGRARTTYVAERGAKRSDGAGELGELGEGRRRVYSRNAVLGMGRFQAQSSFMGSVATVQAWSDFFKYPRDPDWGV